MLSPVADMACRSLRRSVLELNFLTRRQIDPPTPAEGESGEVALGVGGAEVAVVEEVEVVAVDDEDVRRRSDLDLDVRSLDRDWLCCGCEVLLGGFNGWAGLTCECESERPGEVSGIW